jgi:hypothetical protein
MWTILACSHHFTRRGGLFKHCVVVYDVNVEKSSLNRFSRKNNQATKTMIVQTYYMY